jgi:sarcosine oxidase subunit gamma
VAKKTIKAEQPVASATDALMRDVMKKQEIAKAVAISRAADFTGKSQKDIPTPNPSPQGGGGTGTADAKSPSPSRGGVRGGGESSVQRRPANAGREASGQGVRVAVLPPAERISLRAPAASVAALSKALGVKLPAKPKTSSSAGGRTALWLGPDEWLIVDEDGNDPLADCAKVKVLHSAVGISHRNVAIAVGGPNCEATVGSGCPQDLSLAAFPVGACSRTILGKTEIVLLRTAEDAFRLECWRSFSDYVFAFLADAARDAAA